MKLKNMLAGDPAVCAPATETSGADIEVTLLEGVSIECFPNEIPSFVESELERLYGNVYSSMIQWRTYGTLGQNTSTYVVRKGYKIATLFLYQQAKTKIKVLNEVIRIDSPEINRFTNYIFANYPSAQVIEFNAIETDVQRLAYPFQRYNRLEDMAMPLPDTAQAYLSHLGKNTRRNIKRYMDRLKQNFPTLAFEFAEKQDVSAEWIRDIVDFNRARMAGKCKVSDLNDIEAERITRIAQACGLVGVLKIDGRICAGAISYRVGDDYFLYVLAHDPQYDHYWIGILCCYLAICECIARGGKMFHFLWGRYDYKYTLGAEPRDLDNVVVYRSRLARALHGDLALKTAINGHIRQLKVALCYKGGEHDGLMLKTMRNALHYAKAIKRLPARLKAKLHAAPADEGS